MNNHVEYLRPSQAAKKLGVSQKALRLYERRGLIAPLRDAAGWRTYGPDDMARAETIAKLRSLGISLAQIARVLEGGPEDLELVLAARRSSLESQLQKIEESAYRIRDGQSFPAGGEPARSQTTSSALNVAFDLPWPWGGERFELCDVRRVNYIVGPLGSGKTRLAKLLAQMLPGAAFVDLDRVTDGAETSRTELDADPDLKSRVDRTMSRLADDGATPTDALTTLLCTLESDGPEVLIIDMIEQDLDERSQRAIAKYLRHTYHGGKVLFMLTRSNAILDLKLVGPDETILHCPANHSPPMNVTPRPGAPGYEAVASCLAAPAVRARTAGVIAVKAPAA